MLAAGIVEVVGVASVVPLVAVISDPAIIQENRILRWLSETLAVESTLSFLTMLACLMLIVVTFRTAIMGWTQYSLIKFANYRTDSLGRRLLNLYLAQPYPWFLSRNSADLSRTILSEVDEIAKTAVMPALLLAKSSVISTFLLALLILTDPVVAAVAGGSMIGLYGTFYLAIRHFTSSVGERRLSANQRRFFVTQELLDGVKAIKVSGKEEVFLGRFAVASTDVAKYRTLSVSMQQLPRFALEFVAIAGMLIVILMLLHGSGGRLEGALPAIGLYGLTAMRLLPVINELYHSVSSLRNSHAALEYIVGELTIPQPRNGGDPTENASLSFDSKIEISQVSYRYPGAATNSLSDVSLVIRRNESVAFVGPTGSGKTTLTDIVLGLLQPDNGKVKVDGTELAPHNVRAWQRRIGYVPQQIFIADDTIAANIALGVDSSEIDYLALTEAAKLADLHEFVGTLPDKYETVVGDAGARLSGGQRQRIAIARALYFKPDVLVFDEATSALDTQTERAVMSAIDRLSHTLTLVMVAHRLSTVKSCDKIFHLEGGRLVNSGSYDEVIDDSNGLPSFKGQSD